MVSTSIRNKSINKNIVEWGVIPFLFFIGFYSKFFLLITLIISVFILSEQRQVGALKIVSLLTFRTFINHGLAVNMEIASNIKWVLLIGCASYLLIHYFYINRNNRIKINKILITLGFFLISNIITSLIFSSLPVVSLSKLLSYSILFIGLMVGVAYTSEYFNLADWLSKWFKLLMAISFVFLFLPLGYLVNGWSFQGIFNQPNMFGILSVLFIALTLFQQYDQKIKFIDFIFLLLTMFMLVESHSRTSLLAGSFLIIYFLVMKFFKRITTLKIVALCVLTILLIIISRPLSEFLLDFLSKGQNLGNILFSREKQLNELISNFKNSPVFGNGFGVPVLNFRSYIFSMDYVVEPGNLIFAVLSYSGIVGFVLFIIYMLQILFSNKYNMFYNPYLFLAPLLISMGEMVFFSSNSIGTFCYMLLAIHVFYKPKIES